MVHQQHVAVCHSDLDQLASRRSRVCRQAQRERQRVSAIPFHFEQQHPVQRVGDAFDARQLHDVPLAAIGVGTSAGGGSADFFEDQKVAFDQVQHTLAARLVDVLLVEQRGARAPLRQAAGLELPCVEADRAVRLPDVDHRLRAARSPTFRIDIGHFDKSTGQTDRLIERRARAALQRQPVDRAAGGERSVGSGAGEHEVGEIEVDVAVGFQRDPGACVAPFVKPIVHQPRVSPHRDAPARGSEIGLGRDRVELVAELIGFVGQQLDQREFQVGHVPLAQLRHGRGQPVKQQRTKAREVTREIVDVGRRCSRLGRARLWLAIELGRAIDSEAELDAGIARIDAVRHAARQRLGRQRVMTAARGDVVYELDQAQAVGGEVAAPIDRDGQAHVAVVVGREVRRQHLDVANAIATFDAHIALVEFLGQRSEQARVQRDAVVQHLDFVEPAQEAAHLHQRAPMIDAAVGRRVRAATDAAHVELRVKVSLRTSPLARNT